MDEGRGYSQKVEISGASSKKGKRAIKKKKAGRRKECPLEKEGNLSEETPERKENHKKEKEHLGGGVLIRVGEKRRKTKDSLMEGQDIPCRTERSLFNIHLGASVLLLNG